MHAPARSTGRRNHNRGGEKAVDRGNGKPQRGITGLSAARRRRRGERRRVLDGGDFRDDHRVAEDAGARNPVQDHAPLPPPPRLAPPQDVHAVRAEGAR